jgi:midasin (ATPase involved in ribosome maturation)
MHVGEIPDVELVSVLIKRCGVAESRAGMMVAVMRELQNSRKRTNVLRGKIWLHYSPRSFSMGRETQR